MKKTKLYTMILLLSLWLFGCMPNNQNERFPIDGNTTENCAADGPGCKQFNEDLKK